MRFSNLRSLLFALTLTLAMAGQSFAQTTLTSEWGNRYLASQGGIFHPQDVGRLSLDFTLPWGFRGNVWFQDALVLRDLQPVNFGNERDLKLYRPTKVGAATVTPSVVYLMASPVRSNDNDVVALNIDASYPLGRLVMSGALELYAPVEKEGPREGVLLKAGTSLPLKARFNSLPDSSFVNPTLRAVYDGGPFGDKSGIVGVLTLPVSQRLGYGFSLDAGPTLSTPLWRARDRKGEIAWTVGVSMTW